MYYSLKNIIFDLLMKRWSDPLQTGLLLKRGMDLPNS